MLAQNDTTVPMSASEPDESRPAQVGQESSLNLGFRFSTKPAFAATGRRRTRRSYVQSSRWRAPALNKPE